MRNDPLLQGLFDDVTPINFLQQPEAPLLNRCERQCLIPPRTRQEPPKTCKRCGHTDE